MLLCRCRDCDARYEAWQEHVCVTKPVTKCRPSVTKLLDSKSKVGRPALGDRPMTTAERVRKYRLAKRLELNAN